MMKFIVVTARIRTWNVEGTHISGDNYEVVAICDDYYNARSIINSGLKNAKWAVGKGNIINETLASISYVLDGMQTDIDYFVTKVDELNTRTIGEP